MLRIRKLRVGNKGQGIRKLGFGNYDSETSKSDSETQKGDSETKIRKLVAADSETKIRKHKTRDSETGIRKL